MNRYGIVDNFTLGNQVNTVISYDQYGFVDGITSTKGGTYLQNWSYDFNNITGNLTRRTGLNSSGSNVSETFTYDDLNRLVTYMTGRDTLSVTYDGAGYGNITAKTDVGTYGYTGGVHNVTSVTEPTELMQNLSKQFIDYTKSGKVSCITDTLVTDEVRELNFIYGPDENRVKTLFTVDGAVVRTKYFALGQYEKETDSTGNVRELYYISGADGVVAVLEKKNNQDSIFYIHKDYLGSYEVISNQNGTVKERYNFDPCFVHRSVAKAEGRRRNPADWSYDNVSSSFFIDRGFTGHEHLDQFNLINMNGRVYDPLMAMFLSPDNFVQSPDLTQNFNRYTYCLNNPLVYSDPSGYTYKAYMDYHYGEGDYWYRGQEPGTWTDWESYHNIGGGGGYYYNQTTSEYKNDAWVNVEYDEVHNNYIIPNSIFTFSGKIAQDLVGFFQETGSGYLPSKSEFIASLTAGPGGAIDEAYKIANTLNEFNPIAQLWDVISYAFTGKDRFGNPMSLTQAGLKALCVVPIFKVGTISYSFGAFKASSKWMRQMASRGWTGNTIHEALTIGKKYSAINKVNPANSATRYVHPTTGQSVVVDDITKEIIHLGGPGYKY